MPIASVDPVFNDHIRELAHTSITGGSAVIQAEQRKWNLPSLDLWDGVPLNITGMNDAFKRYNLNEMVKTAINTAGQKGGGTVADVSCASIQLTYLAAEHRAYSSRHLTPVRQAYLAAGRRQAHGHAAGVFLGSVMGHVQNTLACGYNGSDIPGST